MKVQVINLLKQALIVAVVIAAISFWQTRDVPSGAAPRFSVQRMDGSSHELPVSVNPKITLVYFFAPWCGVCRLSMGNLNSLQSFFPDISVHAIALDYDVVSEVQKFVDEVGVGIPVSLGRDQIRDLWKISAYPTYVLIGRDGKIHGSSVGYSSQFGMIVRVLWTKITD